MPFIAIALCLSLFVGGGAVVASQTNAVDSAAEVWAEAASNLNTEGEVYVGSYRESDAGNKAEVNADTKTKVEVKAEESAHSEARSSDIELNADISGSANLGL